MSFRYTNDLIGTLRHRLLIEAAQRSIARRTFVGVSQGVEVRCSGFGAVLSIRFKPSQTFSESAADAFYYRQPSSSSLLHPAAVRESSLLSASSAETTVSGGRELRLDRVAESIKAASWIAQQQRRAAKAEATQRSLQGCAAAAASSSTGIGLKHWFEDHPDAMVGLLPHQHLTRWCATPWMTAVQYGLPDPGAYLTSQEEVEAAGEGEHQQQQQQASTLPNVLSLQETDPLRIPIGSLHPLHAPALLQLEMGKQQVSLTFPLSAPASTPNTTETAAIMEKTMPARSRVDLRAVRSAQRREMRQDETKFWDRVELIRRAQIASTSQGNRANKGNSKRPYKDLSNTLKDNVEEKVELRFTS